MDRLEILALPLARREVEVPAWGGAITVREITAGERGQLEAYASNAEDGATEHLALLRPRLVVMATLNGDGPMFEGGDVERLAEAPPEPIRVLSDAIMDLSGIGGEALERAEKNLEPTPVGSSDTS